MKALLPLLVEGQPSDNYNVNKLSHSKPGSPQGTNIFYTFSNIYCGGLDNLCYTTTVVYKITIKQDQGYKSSSDNQEF